MKDLLNSLTDGNFVTAINTTNSGQFTGLDNSADQRNGAFMQQGSTMHQMPPNPTTAKPLPKHIQYLNKQGDCNCNK